MTWVLFCTRIKRRFLRPTSIDGASALNLERRVPGASRYGRAGSFILCAALTAFSAAASVPGAGAAGAAPRQRQVWRGIFPKPPDAAVRALKITKGQAFSSGYVFINGRYVPPPYVVERYGNVIRINGIQVTRQMVPWVEFAKTQKGFREVVPEEESREEKTADETSAAAEEDATPARQPSAAPARGAVSLEELFDDGAVAAPASGEERHIAEKHSSAPDVQMKKSETSRPVAKNPPRRQEKEYVFDGEFIANPSTDALVEKINDYRMKCDSRLRAGGYLFFGTRYKVQTGNMRMAKYLVAQLPSIMKDSQSYSSFASEMHRAGLSFLPEAVMRDLFLYRHVSFVNLLERAKQQGE